MRKQTDILYLNKKQLLRLFSKRFPQITALAQESGSASVFAGKLEAYITQHKNSDSHPAQSLRTLIKNDNTVIHELSTERDIEIQTISLLWDFLRGVE